MKLLQQQHNYVSDLK